jgi:hypothetical protein
MPTRPLVLGYHGCGQRVAETIVLRKVDLHESKNDYDWLGHGIYFLEESQSRAQEWALEETGREGSELKLPAVLGAVIDFGNCLNLIDSDALSLVKRTYEYYLQICAEAGREPCENTGPEFRARFLDCAVLNLLHKSIEEEGAQPFDTVRGFFTEGEPLYEGAGLRARDHVQICVRNPECIIGCFLPRE